jgi:hypothetical protein
MSEDTASQSRRTSPLMVIPVHCLVVPLPCATGDDGKPVRLLPRGRFAAPILPIVGRATRATSGGNDLGGCVVSERFSEGHGETMHGKNKSAMPKIILAIRRHCRHLTHMSNTNQRKQALRHDIMNAVKANGLEVTGDFWFMLIFRTESELKKIAKELHI